MRTRTALSAAAVALALVAAGCGGDSGEEQAERAIEEATGGDADVEINDGTVKVVTGTGEVKVSGDEGGVTIESGEGTYQAGAGTKVPEGFPREVPLPDGNPQTAISANGSYNLIFRVDDAEAAFDAYVAQLAKAGFTIDDTAKGEVDGQFFGTASAEGNGWRVQVGGSGSDQQVLSIIVEAA